MIKIVVNNALHRDPEDVIKINRETRWIYCPICKGKTRTKVYEDTVLVKFPLYCPKCQKEMLVDVVKLKMVLSK